MKSKLLSNNNMTLKKDQDIKEKDILIKDLKERGENWTTLLKERDQIISEQSLKIKELSEIIDRKEEQLKVMVNFSKEINKENKSNIQELNKNNKLKLDLDNFTKDNNKLKIDLDNFTKENNKLKTDLDNFTKDVGKN